MMLLRRLYSEAALAADRMTSSYGISSHRVFSHRVFIVGAIGLFIDSLMPPCLCIGSLVFAACFGEKVWDQVRPSTWPNGIAGRFG